MIGGRGHEFGEPAVDVAADQDAPGAQMCLSDPAMKAGAAVQLRIDDDAIASPEVAVAARVDHFARHLVAHDARVLHRNRAAVDLVIGAADAAVRHADKHLARVERRRRHLAGHQFPRRLQDHGVHEATTGFLGARPLRTATTSSAALRWSSTSDSSE